MDPRQRQKGSSEGARTPPPEEPGDPIIFGSPLVRDIEAIREQRPMQLKITLILNIIYRNKIPIFYFFIQILITKSCSSIIDLKNNFSPFKAEGVCGVSLVATGCKSVY